MRYLFILIIVVVQSCVGYSQNLKGTWEGKLNFGTQSLTFVVHIDQQNGAWSAKADSPDQGAYGLPFDIDVSSDSVFLKNPQGIQLNLKIVNDAQLKGDFMQNGMSIPILLARSNRKTDAASVKFQTPQPPYPYDTLDVVIPNTFANLNLAGTITQPKEAGKYPAVILISGSGPQDRDEALFGHKPFHVLADYLSRQGIIVLRYDDRGVQKSEGSFENSTIDDFSKDALSAFQFLREMDKVDINKIGIIGHSEGGLIANLLAGQGIPNLSFIVSLAGPTHPIWEMMVEQLYSVGKAEGLSDLQLAMAREINKKNFEVVRSDLPTQEAYEQLKKNMNMVKDTPQNETIRKELLMMLTPAYRYFVRINPQDFIKDIYIPVYAAFGTLDVQVPSKLNIKGYTDYLPDNSKTLIKEYEGLNHLFQKAQTGRVAEYSKIAETINEEVLKDIAEWIKGL